MAQLTHLAHRLYEHARREGVLPRGAHVVVACSGGPDSLALLSLLLELRPLLSLTVTAAHYEHGIRGEASAEDAAFVRRFCAARAVPCIVERGDVPRAAARTSESLETAARRLRYACFARLCGEGIDVVATAHTANDQAETLLLRLARGTGLHGAAGIRPKRGCYLRPLLALTRQDTESFCRAAGQAWVTDETNATDAYARNRVRRAALPALQSTNGAAVENLARFCEKAARADAYFARKAEELLSAARLDAAQAAIKSPEACTVWRLGPLSAADALILEAAMHSLTAPVRDAEEKYVQLLCGLVRRGSGAVQLTDRVRFCAGDGCFWQEIVPERPRQQEDKRPESQPFQPEKQAEYCLAGGWKVTAGLFTADFEEKIQVVHKKDLKNQADYARITTLYAGLVLRTRQPGDVYRPAGRSVHNRLRKWMNETGIPASQRDQLPLLAAGSEVLWVCGAGFAEGLAPDADTAQVLQMEMEHREEIT